jgi:hypothetical protein
MEIRKALDGKIQEFQATFSKELFKEDFALNHIKYKRCGKNILVMYIPSFIKTNQNRDMVRDTRFAKFRAEQVWCICIFDGTSFFNKYVHKCEVGPNYTWQYKVNRWIFPDMYDMDVNKVCTSGIHFFNHLLAAYYYQFNLRHYPEECQLSFFDTGTVASVIFNGQAYHTQIDKQDLFPRIEKMFKVSGLICC